MRDWREFVQSKLAELALPPGTKVDVVDELAAHLEETYAELRKQGMTEEAAARLALSQVKDWHKLQRKIQNARIKENTMTNRVKQFWLPGLLTFTISMVLLELVQKFFPQPFVLRLDHPPVLLFYVPWLLTLPLAGTLGACLSKRAGGSKRMTLLSSAFPVLPLAAIFLMAIPVGLALSHTLSHGIVAAAFLTLGVAWVAVPGLILLVGGFLAQFLFSRRSDSRRIAS
jgi:hypothetical protein